MREKIYPFTREGIEKCFKHKDYIRIAKNTLIEYPEILPLALLGVLGLSIVLISPMASTVAYKTMTDSSIVAFKFLEVF